MSLIDRLLHIDADPSRNLQVHTFGSALHELIRGRLSRASIISLFNLTGDDVTELDVLIANGLKMTPDSRFKYAQEVEDVFMLAEFGASGYSTHSEVAALLNNPRSGDSDWRIRRRYVLAGGNTAGTLTGAINTPAITQEGTLTDQTPDSDGSRRRCRTAAANNGDAGFFSAVAMVSRAFDPDFTFKFKVVSSAVRRVWIGFFESDPMASDALAGSVSHFGLRLSTAPAVTGFVISHSDGTTTTLESQIQAADTNVHTIRLVGDQSNARWGYSFDNADVVWISSNVPLASDAMLVYCQIRTLEAVLKDLDFWFMDGYQDK